MPQSISPDDLAEWERVTNEATEGPWYGETAERIVRAPSGFIVADMSLIEPKSDASANADFIALAREAMPRLIAEVKALRAERDSIDEQCDCGEAFRSPREWEEKLAVIPGWSHAPARLGGCRKGEK